MCHPPEEASADPWPHVPCLEAGGFLQTPTSPSAPAGSAAVLLLMSLSAPHGVSAAGAFWVISAGPACGPLEGTPWTLVQGVC